MNLLLINWLLRLNIKMKIIWECNVYRIKDVYFNKEIESFIR